jgi:hypothetical protein
MSGLNDPETAAECPKTCRNQTSSSTAPKLETAVEAEALFLHKSATPRQGLLFPANSPMAAHAFFYIAAASW